MDSPNSVSSSRSSRDNHTSHAAYTSARDVYSLAAYYIIA